MSPSAAPPALSLFPNIAVLHYHIHQSVPAATSLDHAVPVLLPNTIRVLQAPADILTPPLSPDAAKALAQSSSEPVSTERVLVDQKLLEEFKVVEQALKQSSYIIPHDLPPVPTNTVDQIPAEDTAEPIDPSSGLAVELTTESTSERALEDVEQSVSEAERDLVVKLVDEYSEEEEITYVSKSPIPTAENLDFLESEATTFDEIPLAMQWPKPAPEFFTEIEPEDQEQEGGPQFAVTVLKATVASEGPISVESLSPGPELVNVIEPQEAQEEGLNGVPIIIECSEATTSDECSLSTRSPSPDYEFVAVIDAEEHRRTEDDGLPLMINVTAPTSEEPMYFIDHTFALDRIHEIIASLVIKLHSFLRSLRSWISATTVHIKSRTISLSPLLIVLAVLLVITVLGDIVLFIKLHHRPPLPLELVMKPGRVGETFDIFTHEPNLWDHWHSRSPSEVSVSLHQVQRTGWGKSRVIFEQWIERKERKREVFKLIGARVAEVLDDTWEIIFDGVEWLFSFLINLYRYIISKYI
jgi:hypothetical protein